MNSSAAKKKVKTHINRHKKGTDFQFTERHVIYWFGVINRAAFRNLLPLPEFKIKHLPGAWGWCVADEHSTVIKLSTNINTREMFLATLAHEMVHQYQYMFDKKMNHGESFIVWKRFFKRHMRIEI